ncbi:MauE/DoxX family redox-associated membrane protein [Streptomyces xanthochromogenes]|uniref:MauE/DoxX family redox-associated membrane protein n=1 Tax=Streptomyces xanthochromogenes TaxID=67384 RepID=UPI00344666C5
MDSSTRAIAANRFSKRRSWFPLHAFTARITLVLVWGWAGCSKIRSPDASVEAVRVYRVLPESLLAPVGYGLPALELALAALLLLGLRIRLTAALSAGLLVAFIAGIAQAGIRGLSIDCGCFGGGGEVGAAETQYVKEILRDLLFLCASTWLVHRPTSPYALDNRLC